MLPIIRSTQSEEDLIAVWRYIAADNPAAATRLLERIDERIELLKEFPLMGSINRNLARELTALSRGSFPVHHRTT